MTTTQLIEALQEAAQAWYVRAGTYRGLAYQDMSKADLALRRHLMEHGISEDAAIMLTETIIAVQTG